MPINGRITSPSALYTQFAQYAKYGIGLGAWKITTFLTRANRKQKQEVFFWLRFTQPTHYVPIAKPLSNAP